MMKVFRASALRLVTFLILMVLAAAGAGAAGATEYRCPSGNDKCAITDSGLAKSIYCMKKNANWQCVLPSMGNMECSRSSETRKLPGTFWGMPTNLCSNLCGTCSSGWIKYEGGGSTF